MSQENITSESLYRLYKEQINQPDEQSGPLSETVSYPGIYIARQYPENHKEYKKDKWILVSIYLVGGKFIHGDLKVGLKIDNEEHNYNLPNSTLPTFNLSGEDNIIFSLNTVAIKQDELYELRIADLVDVMIDNHLNPGLFLRAKAFYTSFRIFLNDSYLKFIFWLVGSKYDKSFRFIAIDNDRRFKERKKIKDPIFNHFDISKNAFAFFTFTFLFLVLWLSHDVNLEIDIFWLAWLAAFLVLIEKLMTWIFELIEDDSDKSFVKDLENYQFRQSFQLRIPKKYQVKT